MCGIFAILGLGGCNDCLKREAIYQSKKMKHRGPDWSGYIMDNNVIFNGAQPIVSTCGDIVLAVNGEIYNYKEIKEKEEFKENEFTTQSDCEVIINLYKKYGPHFMEKNILRGMFAFVMHDKKKSLYIVARDHMGIIPLYFGYKEERFHVASEMKCLVDCKKLEIFPPRHYCINNNHYRFYHPDWMDNIGTKEIDLALMRGVLEKAVISHMMSDVPKGC